MSADQQPTIKDFLLARIAEDEEQAEVCKVMRWVPAKKYGITVTHPKRVLAECAAKRAIIGPPVSEDLKAWGHGVGASPDTLRALASVYSDHPDYRQEWAPNGTR